MIGYTQKYCIYHISLDADNNEFIEQIRISHTATQVTKLVVVYSDGREFS